MTMDNQVLIALITLIGTIASGIISAVIANKLTVYRIEQLEKKVDKHNNLIERTYKLEERLAIVENDINDMKK